MKIQLSKPETDRHCRHASRLMVVIGVLAFAIIAGSDVTAQTTSFGNFATRVDQVGNASSGQGAVAQAGQFVNDGQSYRVMNASQVPTAADMRGSIGAAISNGGAVQQVGCQSCGTSCGGACGGGYSAYGDGSFANSYSGSFSGGNACNYGNQCGIPCDPYCYARVEGLYMQREDASRGLSRQIRFQDFDLEWAPRITIGSLPNCVNGYEMTFVGPLEWNTAGAVINGAGQFGTIFGPPVALPNAALTAAQTLEAQRRNLILAQLLPDALSHDSQIESLRSEFWSVEANRTLVGWDVAKVLFGGRYIQYDEDSFFSGTRATAPTAVSAASSTENQMVGAQIGLDLLYPVGVFAYSDFRARAGVYYNQNESQITSFNGATLNDREGSLAGVYEMGSGIRYQVGEILSVRAGTEVWYVSGVAAANDQYRQINFDALNGVLTSQVDNDHSFFVYGFNLAAELKY